MPTRDRASAYYVAGIGVFAAKAGIGIKQLSLRQARAKFPGAILEPIRKWCTLEVAIDDFKILQLEDFITTCLSGSAARLIYLEDSCPPLKKSLGTGGLELQQLREMWQCVEPETDRAFALAFGSLGQIDDGDTEATLLRLWRRALRTLREPKHYARLNLLARHLDKVGEMNGREVARLFVD